MLREVCESIDPFSLSGMGKFEKGYIWIEEIRSVTNISFRLLYCRAEGSGIDFMQNFHVREAVPKFFIPIRILNFDGPRLISSETDFGGN